ncbi:MAG TPA: glycosyltransferase family 4 protein [Candidatus Limnocylindria bacterium]
MGTQTGAGTVVLDIAQPLRIALLSGPMVRIPPPGYAGTERIVAVLVEELVRRGHQVTLIGPGDSNVSCELIPTIERALWSSGMRGDLTPYIQVSMERAWSVHERFDVMHSHLDTYSFGLARHCATPVVHTLHGRLDTPGVPELLDEFTEIPLVAISESQRRWWPDNNWVATVHHGLPLENAPFSPEAGNYLVLVGRIAEEKGVQEAIDLARMTRLPLRIAAKVHEDAERYLFQQIVQPAIDEGVVEFVGELANDRRDELLAGARATLMLGAWPEPFGLVAIESMATGTPVIGRRAGALTELIEHGENGFLVDDLMEARFAVQEVGEIDRAFVRERAIERFSVERMVDEYEAVYRVLAAGGRRETPGTEQAPPDAGRMGRSPASSQARSQRPRPQAARAVVT